MKHLIHILLTCFCFLAGMNAFAYDAYIDGIYYVLANAGYDREIDEAWVTNKGGGYDNNSYAGTVVIPEFVTYDGKTYKVTTINSKAFSFCRSLQTVIIPKSVTTIGGNAFDYSSLISISIPESVEFIPSQAFYYCSDLTSVTISQGVKKIGDEVFRGCDNLTSITIPNSVTTIGSAFYNCTSLTSVSLGNGLTSIDGTFSGCTGLTSITIPESVTNIGSGTFSGCTGLTSITIPGNVTSIGRSAFSGCSNLTSITIPESVISVGQDAFSGTPWYKSQPDGVVYAGRVAYQYKGNMPEGTDVTIKEGTIKISDSAFGACTGLSSVVIPNSVITIGNGAFSSCSGLSSVTIGNSVTNIGDYAFNYCTSLTDVYCFAEATPSANGLVFDNSSIASATLHVPESSVALYKATTPWSRFGTIVAIKDSEIQKCATPTISYANGMLTFKSETEGAVCLSTITNSDISTFNSNEVQLNVTYHISVYAAKVGYDNSEVATATLCWIDVAPQTEGLTDEDPVAEVKALPVLIQSNCGTITIQGTSDGTEVYVYNANGMMQGSAIADKGITTLNTALQPGSVAIVKVGEKAIKVLIK